LTTTLSLTATATWPINDKGCTVTRSRAVSGHVAVAVADHAHVAVNDHDHDHVDDHVNDREAVDVAILSAPCACPGMAWRAKPRRS